MTAANKTIDTCNALLRGEISAIETYTQAIEKYAGSPGGDSLGRIRADHEESAAALRHLVSESGAAPSTESGLWGGFVQALEGTAALIGQSPALTILEAGEEHGISQYNKALADTEISNAAKELIGTRLLPKLSAHLVELTGLKARSA